MTALAVSRPLFWLNSATLCVIAVVLSGVAPGWREVALIAFATWPLNLFVYAINDRYDAPSDRRNPRKGGAEGALVEDDETLREMLIIAAYANAPFVLYFVATAPAPRAVVALAGLYAVAWAYSAPPLRAKSRPGWDSLANAGYVLPLVFACLHLGVAPPWRETAAFALWAIGSHAFTSIQDASADRAAGVRTIATALGARRSGVVAIACYAWAASLVVWQHPVFGMLPLVYAALVAETLRRHARGARHAMHGAYRLFMALNAASGFAITTAVALAHPRTTFWTACVMLGLCAATAAATVLARAGARVA